MQTDVNAAPEQALHDARTDRTPLQCDVLIIGGGPAGSTAATLLARRGWSVRLLEKERHPRFHIGESLLPMNLRIFERLGVREQIEAIGIRKPGADFPADNERGYNVFSFATSLRPCGNHAYQVRREHFDELLFRNAAAAGAATEENVLVTQVSCDHTGVVASVRHGDGSTDEVRARYVIDASGRDTLLGRQWRLKRPHALHRSAAMFAHFTGVERRPGEHAGNISIYRYDAGWIWVIPLQHGITSIGAVCDPGYLKRRHGSQQDFLWQTLRSIPQLAARLTTASMATEVQATGNYSYCCERLAGSRWLLVGDAYAFLDPVFSSGVYIAMYSAERAAEIVDTSLRAPARERRLQRAYQRDLERGLAVFTWFILRFNTPAIRYLFANPRNMLRMQEAVVSILAGDVFEGGAVMRRVAGFKLLYLVTSAFMWREVRRYRRRLRDSRALTAADLA